MRREWLQLGVILATLSVGCAPTLGASAAQKNAESASEETAATLLDRGKAFAALGDLTRAEQYLAAALARGADGHVVLPMLVRVCVQDGRFRAAAMYTEEYARRHPADGRARVLAGVLHEAVGEDGRARENLERAIELEPANVEARFALASVLARTGDLVGADVQRQAFLRLAPGDPRADDVRARLLHPMPGG